MPACTRRKWKKSLSPPTARAGEKKKIPNYNYWPLTVWRELLLMGERTVFIVFRLVDILYGRWRLYGTIVPRVFQHRWFIYKPTHKERNKLCRHELFFDSRGFFYWINQLWSKRQTQYYRKVTKTDPAYATVVYTDPIKMYKTNSDAFCPAGRP